MTNTFGAEVVRRYKGQKITCLWFPRGTGHITFLLLDGDSGHWLVGDGKGKEWIVNPNWYYDAVPEK